MNRLEWTGRQPTITFQKNLYLYALCLVLFVGCSTSYQKQAGGSSGVGSFLVGTFLPSEIQQGFIGGFSEVQLDPQTFRVTFKGNEYTSRERVTDFVLLRSAELALAHGFAYFIITESEDYIEGASPTVTNTIVCSHQRPQVQRNDI